MFAYVQQTKKETFEISLILKTASCHQYQFPISCKFIWPLYQVITLIVLHPGSR